MTNEDLKSAITALLATATFDDADETCTAQVEAGEWRALATQLRSHEALQFDFLVFCTCVDWKTHLTMVYQLYSYTHQHNLKIKVKLDAGKPEVETICDLWRTAEFHEREVYELFGVNFLNHPDLRLLILPDGWEGRNPLRKDFDDPVNMIRL